MIGSTTDKNQAEVIEELVRHRWPIASRGERTRLVEIMCAFYSPKWFGMLDKAKKKQLDDYDLILAKADIIEDNAYEGLSRSDGTIVVPDSVQELRPQLDALLSYTDFRSANPSIHD